MPTVARPGEWKSPISLDMLVQKRKGIHNPILSGSRAYWLEDRPDEDGGTAFMEGGIDGHRAMIPSSLCPRTKLCGYQAPPIALCTGGIVFSRYDKKAEGQDHRLYMMSGGLPPGPITPQGSFRYGQLVADDKRARVIGVRETVSGNGNDKHEIVAANYYMNAGVVQPLVTDHHFAFWPEVSPDGKALAYITWEKGVMAWDETTLWVAPFNGQGLLGDPIKVAGGRSGESVIQARWSPDGTLHFMSNQSGYWNLHWFKDGKVERLLAIDADCSGAPWPHMNASFGFRHEGSIILKYTKDAAWKLLEFSPETLSCQPIELPYTYIGGMAVDRTHALFTAGSPTCFPELVRMNLTDHSMEVLERSSTHEIDPGYLPEPEHVSFPTANGQTAYGIVLRARNKDYRAPEGEKFPTVLEIHGGPFAADPLVLSLHDAALTSRGYNVLRLNFRGSSGYGRQYKDLLYGNWGDIELEDAEAFINLGVDRYNVDRDRVVATGASGGGYTSYMLAARRPGLVCGVIAGCGVTDLSLLHKYGGKLEEMYVDQLVPPSLWRERSPVEHASKIACPTLIFQGKRDVVVPLDQPQAMADALRRSDVPYMLRVYKDGWHGWTEEKYLRDEHKLTYAGLARMFGVHPPEDLPEIPWGESEI